MKKLIALSIVAFALVSHTTQTWHGWHHGWHGGWHRPWYGYDYGIGAGLVTAAALNANRQPDTVIIHDNNKQHVQRINDLEDQNDALKERLKKLEDKVAQQSNSKHK